MRSPYSLLPLLPTILLSSAYAQAEGSPLQPQTDTFNSSYRLTPQQVAAASIDSTTAANVEVALNFERSNWASGSTINSPFYQATSNSSYAAVGSLLKLEVDANTSAYTLPPQTAISRIMYQSETLNGSLVPTSAYILWPYTPRRLADGSYPIVSWAHATSGVFAECGPSHIRNLWYHFMVPYALVQAGYVVVAPDYQGLGVGHDAQGRPISHPYLANPSHANDVFYAIEAAQKAFSTLSHQFVIVGHSQGGGVAWGAAERQAKRPVEGYLGTVAGSPLVNFIATLDFQEATNSSQIYLGALVARGLQSVFLDFDIRDVFTSKGARRFRLAEEIQGCNPVFTELLSDSSNYRPGWYHKPLVENYVNETGAGRRDFAGPLLVIQGSTDPSVPVNVTDAVVHDTCELHPDESLEYQLYQGASHIPAMYAAQRNWLRWIEDRFEGKKAQQGCEETTFQSALPNQQYQAELNWFIEYGLDTYELQ